MACLPNQVWFSPQSCAIVFCISIWWGGTGSEMLFDLHTCHVYLFSQPIQPMVFDDPHVEVNLTLSESNSSYGGLAPQQVDSNFLLLMCFLKVNSKLICCFQGAGREGLYVQTEFIAVVAALLIWWSANNVKSKLQESQAGSIGLKFLTLSTTVKHFFFVFNKIGYKNKNFE